ncbi:MAG: 30S ribosomal protein S4 [Gemmatimonadetes bacterium]|uniref:Small ribosomal subunit protein uS4 n=1 Tax=Candidatus Kutchimonas denitrificans TaxID=3056748 RepID=A0AAE5CC97_9BACT|nr:30S ribosomal protein S4 [Gemmatimonadota bacterium]NIR73874.1 30S ribosomal protein S4 [Candidatus Kutchimonas denitrificans]NIR99680.1 30S ribosomal protein S4 [Gemmatimonadota bacterium]NIT65265.1 30S ribosomal protein S4 [Gemmatimonadota bacterium]NIW73714.1 30S ribosomal protein S4 [Gemmatimonadota bacterium]
MARYTGPVCKLCRREGQKLFLKGKRCHTEKCAIERRNYPPGQHGMSRMRRRRMSDYAVQLREKQKVRRIYGLQEEQFRKLFQTSSRGGGITGDNLIVALETRLDNMVYRLGFAPSRKSARQLVRHRHIEVEGAIVNIPSFEVKPGMEISVKSSSRDLPLVKEAVESSAGDGTLGWISVDHKKLTGRMVEKPTRADVPLAVQEQLIVELYSK